MCFRCMAIKAIKIIGNGSYANSYQCSIVTMSMPCTVPNISPQDLCLRNCSPKVTIHCWLLGDGFSRFDATYEFGRQMDDVLACALRCASREKTSQTLLNVTRTGMTDLARARLLLCSLRYLLPKQTKICGNDHKTQASFMSAFLLVRCLLVQKATNLAFSVNALTDLS